MEKREPELSSARLAYFCGTEFTSSSARSSRMRTVSAAFSGSGSRIAYDPNPTIHLALANAILGGFAEEARHIAMAMIARGSEGADRLERASNNGRTLSLDPSLRS